MVVEYIVNILNKHKLIIKANSNPELIKIIKIR